MRFMLCAALLAAALSAPLPAHAQTPPAPGDAAARPKSGGSGIVGLDVMTSTVFEQGQSSFSGFAGRLRLRHSRLVHNLEFLPTIEYWSNTSKVHAFDIQTNRRDATLATDVRWVFSRARWQPYVGVGLAVHFLNENVHSPAQTPAESNYSTERGALAALGGVEFGVGEKIGTFLEAKFHDASGYRQVKISTGLDWSF